MLATLGVAAAAHADVLILRNGQAIRGEVVSESPEEVLFRGEIAGIWATARFERSRIERIKIEPGDQSEEETKARTREQGKPLADQPAHASKDAGAAKQGGSVKGAGRDGRPEGVKGVEGDSAAKGAPGSGAGVIAGGEVVEVQVEGEGATADDALDDAVRSALLRVVGTYIRSDTTVEQERAARERIIAHSGGYIARVEKVGAAKQDGAVFRQTAKVAVRKSKVAEAIAEPASPDGGFDGATLSARIKILQEQSASGQELFSAVFEGWPGCVLRTAVAEAPRPIALPQWIREEMSLAADEIYLETKIDVSVDREMWASWCQGASEALRAISLRRASLRWSVTGGGLHRLPSEQVKIDSDTFVQDEGFVMSEAAARARHFHPGLAIMRFEQEVQAIARRSAADEGSVKAGIPPVDRLILVALSVSDQAPVELYLLDRSLVHALGDDDLNPPSIEVRILDSESGQSLGLPWSKPLPPEVARSLGAPGLCGLARNAQGSGPMAAFEAIGFQAATPARLLTPGFVSVDGGVQEAVPILLIAPWLASGPDAAVFSEFVSLPFGFTIERDLVRRAGKVSVRLSGQR